MSILIRGMEMPKAGNWITIRIYPDGTCAKPNWQGDCKYMKGCEAIPVPPHGKLIDADALEYHADNVRDPMGRTEKTVMWNKIQSAPTIIEAEVSE